MTAGAKQPTSPATSRPQPPPQPQPSQQRKPPAGAPALTFPARDVLALLEALERLGYDGDALLVAATLSRASLQDPDGHVPCEQCGAIFCEAQQVRPMKNLQLRLAEQMPIGAFPLIDYLVVTADSVGQAFAQLARYFRLVTGNILFEIHEEEDPVRVVLESPPGFNAEFLVALAIVHMRREADGPFGALAISIAQPVDDVADYERALGCPVRPNASWTGWLFARETWRLPLRRRDPILRSVLERHADVLVAAIPALDGIALDVRRALAARIAGGDADIEAVARQLATTPRTLQRRLAAVGSSFHALVEQTRREAAERYLAASTLSIAEIGYLLGYSEAAAFHRAFKRWNGQTPHAFRAQRTDRASVTLSVPA